MQLPTIALTMGDPAGVGPELMLHALRSPEIQATCQLVAVGNLEVLRRCSQSLGIELPPMLVANLQSFMPGRGVDASASGCQQPTLIDIDFPNAANFEPGKVSAECGRLSFEAIESAISLVQAKKVSAVTTGPINKSALHAAGILFPGHTEIFAARDGATRWCMMQYSPEITCSFVTVHVGYADVPPLITEQSVLDTIELTDEALTRLLGRKPNLVVCGLNPHAGEDGLFGNREEELAITPAIRRARDQGIMLEGPLPPDTAFLPAKRQVCDAFICMYHDQGHIPLKALAFDTAVNTTLGLSIIRTSVDHGTAYDIAWQGIASNSSLYAALRLAAKLAPSIEC
ncbi:MAG: 4-hydroxythreonine-4-phosphate dehydrogenase PdxA [Planctomycetales bacterium]|nr:4-hydroxythreonine-4-phosphate dehydrogenase PdxA [Planctomycetales bacterium]